MQGTLRSGSRNNSVFAALLQDFQQVEVAVRISIYFTGSARPAD